MILSGFGRSYLKNQFNLNTIEVMKKLDIGGRSDGLTVAELK